ALWGGKPNRSLYRRIVVMDPVEMEMEGLSFLEKDEHLRSLFMASSSGIHPNTLVHLKNRLYSESQALIRPRSKEGWVNQLLERYLTLQRTIRDMEHQRDRYPNLLKERDALEARLTEIQGRLEELEREKQWLELLDRARSHWIQCRTLQQDLEKLEDASSFQEHWWETYQQLYGRLETIKGKQQEVTLKRQRMEADLGDPPETSLLPHRDTLLALREERAWWRETLERIRDLEERKTWLQQQVEDLLHQTGLTLSPETLARLPRSPEFQREAQELALAYRQVHTALQEHRALRPPAPPVSAASLQDVGSLVQAWIQQHREIQELTEEQEQLQFLLATGDALPWWSPWVVGFGVGGGVYLLLRALHVPIPPLPAAGMAGGLVGGTLATVWAVLTWQHRRQQRPIVHRLQEITARIQEQQEQLHHTATRLTALGLPLHGTPDTWTPEMLEDLHTRVQTFRQWQEEEHLLLQRQEALNRRWESLMQRIPEDIPYTIDTYLDLVEPLRTLQARMEQIHEITRELQQLRDRLASRVQSLRDVFGETWSEPPDAPVWLTRLEEALKRLEKEETLQENWQHKQEQLRQLEEMQEVLRVEQTQLEEQLAALYREAGATDRQTFLQRRERFRRWSTLHQDWLRARQSLLALLGSEEALKKAQTILQETDAMELNTRRQQTERELHALQQEHTRLLERRGELNRILREMEEERTLQDLYQQETVLQEQIMDGLREWGKRMFALHVLSKAQYIYEQEKQPEIVNRASAYLAHITRRPYRLHAPLVNPSGIQVEHTEHHAFRSEDAWSRGLLEQVLLALRLAFATEFTRMMEGLPILLDEVFAHFDPTRMEESARMLTDISTTHQIFFFTCHPELAEILHAAGEQAGRSITRITLAGGTVVERKDHPA
ncbi:MAG: hypothetical protein L3J76_02490, partial [Candidatus Hydrothermae bacterium]|nr:hypothetical protein [Candidatus Hydrothermae bacterium]